MADQTGLSVFLTLERREIRGFPSRNPPKVESSWTEMTYDTNWPPKWKQTSDFSVDIHPAIEVYGLYERAVKPGQWPV